MPPVLSRTIIRSSPRTTSGYSVEASTSGSSTMAGRKLANRSSSLRRRRMASSGRSWKPSFSHFGPPTEPNRMASASRAFCMVSSVIGVPRASIAAPPTRSSDMSNVTMRRRSSQSMMRRTSRITSGPMPSPGRISSLLLAGIGSVPSCQSRRGRRNPWLALPPRCLVGVDLRRVLQRLADVVETVQQQVLAERVDIEVDFLAVRPHHHLARQIDGEAGVAAELGVVDQLVADRPRQPDRQDAVLEAVVVEDVGEVRRDDAADAEIQQRPRRVLTRAAAAEVLVRDDDLRLAVWLLVEHEIGAFVAVVVVAQRVEQVHAEAGTLDGLEEAGGYDLVGVDVLHRHRRGDGGQRDELVHRIP